MCPIASHPTIPSFPVAEGDDDDDDDDDGPRASFSYSAAKADLDLSGQVDTSSAPVQESAVAGETDVDL